MHYTNTALREPRVVSRGPTRRRPQRRFQDYWSLPYRRMDYGLILSVLALVAVGLIMVYSASFILSLEKTDTTIYFFRRQVFAAIAGLVGVIVFQFADYQIIRRYSTIAMGVVLLALLVVLAAGATKLGARRGLWQGSYQPSEFAKLITIAYMADWLSTKGDRIKTFGLGVFPFVILVGIVGAMIVSQPDLSTAILLALVAFTMFFIAGARWAHFIMIGIVGSGVAGGLIMAMPHARQRMASYLDQLLNPALADYHSKQAYYALARGGITGLGLGNSFQKTGWLPVPHTDSILAVTGEELGLIGCLALLAALTYVVIRGYRITTETVDPYGRLLALGITSWLAYQSLIHAAVITGVMPVTGVPLPFISYGGTSMLVSLLGIGVLLNISQQNKRIEDGLARPRGQKRTGHATAGLGRRDRRTHLSRAGHNR